MDSTNSGTTVEKFRECFARFGLRRVVVTDNGPQFCAIKFSQFLYNNVNNHNTSPPYHPATNGFAENSVKSLKGFYRQ